MSGRHIHLGSFGTPPASPEPLAARSSAELAARAETRLGAVRFSILIEDTTPGDPCRYEHEGLATADLVRAIACLPRIGGAE